MASFYELFDSRTTEKSKDHRTDVRLFRVSLDVATDDPCEFVGVAPDDLHPTYPELRCDVVRCLSRIGVGLDCIVEARYSDNARFTLPDNTDITEFQGWDLNYMRSSATVPVLVKQSYCSPAASGGVVTSKRWVRQDIEKEHFYITAEKRVRVGQFTAAMRVQISDQMGKYHDLSGNVVPDMLSRTLYQFRGAREHQVGRTEWEIVYSWFRDPGVSPITPPTLADLPSGMLVSDILAPFATLQAPWYGYRPPFGAWAPMISPVTACSSIPTEPPAAKIVSIANFTVADITTAAALAFPGNPLGN